MASIISDDVGKWAVLTVSNPTAHTNTGEFCMVLSHVVNSSKTSEDRADLAIFKTKANLNKAIRALTKGDSSKSVQELVESFAKSLLPDRNNQALSKILGPSTWRAIFDPTAERAVPGPTAPPAGTGPTGADPLVGKKFTGNIPTIDSGVIVHKSGDWTVSKLAAAGQYELTARIAGADVSVTMTKLSVEAAIAAAATPTVTAFDTDFVLADYPWLIKVLGGFAKISRDKISAQVVIGAAVAAGEPKPACLDSTTSASALRRLASVAADSMELWCEHAQAQSRAVKEGLTTSTELYATLKALRQSYRLEVLGVPTSTTVAAPTGPAVGAGAIPAATGGAVAVGSSHPRYDALGKKASNAAEFLQFAKDALSFSDLGDRALAVISTHEETRAREVEKWLKSFGDKADPAVLSSLPDGQTAGGLLARCLALRPATPATVAPGDATVSLTGNNATLQQRVRLCVRSSTGGESETVSEQEKRERMRVQADAMELESDEPAMQRLAAMADLADIGDDASREKLHDEVEKETDGALIRLLTTAVDMGAVSVDAEPSTMAMLDQTRSVLDASLERAVYGAHAPQPSDIVIRALRNVRLGRISKVRLLHLLDSKDSSWSIEAPLAGFASLPLATAATDFAQAVQYLQAAWILVMPTSSGQVMQFCTQLVTKVKEALTAGASWEDIGEFYKALMRRVDRVSSGFAGKHAAPEPPDARWAKDAIFDWVAKLNRKITKADVKSEHSSEMSALKLQMQQLQQQIAGGGKRNADQATSAQGGVVGLGPGGQLSKKQKRDLLGITGTQTKQPTGKGNGKTTGQRQQQQTQQQQTQPQSQPQGQPAGTQRAGATGAPGNKAPDPNSMRSQAKALTLELGMKDGKQPCFFHHRGGGCKFDADSCKGWHA
jgi:hypothetical protein